MMLAMNRHFFTLSATPFTPCYLARVEPQKAPLPPHPLSLLTSFAEQLPPPIGWLS